MSLTFSTHFILHVLKLVLGQMVTKFEGRREYFILILNFVKTTRIWPKSMIL